MVLFWIIGFIRSQTQRNSTTSMIAEANLDVTRSIFVPSRLRSDRLKRSSDVAFLPCASEDLQDFRQEDLFTIFCYFAPVTRHSFQAMCTMFSRKDVFTLFDGRLRIFTRKTNDEPRFEPRVEAREKCEGGGRETPARRPLLFSFLTSTRRMLKS